MPILTVPAEAAADTLLYLGTDASPSVFTSFIGRLGDISGPNTSVAIVDVSNQESKARRKLGTLLDSGTVTANLYWVPSDAQDASLFDIYRSTPPVLRSYQMVWPDGVTWLFAAYISKWSPASKIADALRTAIEFTIDGEIEVI